MRGTNLLWRRPRNVVPSQAFSPEVDAGVVNHEGRVEARAVGAVVHIHKPGEINGICLTFKIYSDSPDTFWHENREHLKCFSFRGKAPTKASVRAESLLRTWGVELEPGRKLGFYDRLLPDTLN